MGCLSKLTWDATGLFMQLTIIILFLLIFHTIDGTAGKEMLYGIRIIGRYYRYCEPLFFEVLQNLVYPVIYWEAFYPPADLFPGGFYRQPGTD
jgi:hypothetical protein